MEKLIVTLGMTFVGVIVICFIWMIFSYIVEEYFSESNNLEDNIKKLDKKNGYRVNKSKN
tara:strand:+ start:415 stop:594 length:180 start_codon:yes stop_codon:yes gene_type:complete